MKKKCVKLLGLKGSTFENYTEHGPCLLDIHITCTIADENFTHPIFRESAQI